ncbi:hypothetical protein HWI79_3724 [Cryptosporidium felis]|nr:hypothetical protein HWI79_3724 [Cryptosporidium felis]
MNSSILEYCNHQVRKILDSQDGIPEKFLEDFCYEVLKTHLQLVVNRQHFAENIYDASSKLFCGAAKTNPQAECSPASESSKTVVTPELAYLISDLLPVSPEQKDCVTAIMRVMALPFGLEKKKAEQLCKSVLELGRSHFFFRRDFAQIAPNNLAIPTPTNKLTPFKRSPPFVEIQNPHGVGGVKCSSERVSTAKNSIQGFGKLITLPFINSPVASIEKSEKYLKYSHTNHTAKFSETSKLEIQKLNSQEEIIFNDDIFSDLILPCKTLNYEAKILASILFYYSNLLKTPITVEDVCIVCMRSVLIPAISLPNVNAREKKKGILPSEVVNPFIPTCVNAFMTSSLFTPANKLSREYVPSLKTSEAASKAFAKLCSKAMNRYITIFGMIGIGNHSISCNPAQVLLINSLQVSLWTQFNALIASNELAQVACRVNLDSRASQASGECINLLGKIISGLSDEKIKALCQSTVKFLQPQPIVITPILYTISSIFQAVTEAAYRKNGALHALDFVKLSRKILRFARPKMNPEEYITSCRALLEANLRVKITSWDSMKICKATSKPVLSVVLHYHIPLELQLFHKKQFGPRVAFIRKAVSSYVKLVKKELNIARRS